MKATLYDIQMAVDEFAGTYWKPKDQSVKVGKPYCLFPDKLSHLPGDLSGKWPDSWPNGSKKGVYLVLNEKMELLYIGKASMNSAIGARLSAWFPGTKNCKVNGQWTEEPTFLATIPVPDQTPFLAAALEEFLIGKFNPSDNTHGVRIQQDQ